MTESPSPPPASPPPPDHPLHRPVRSFVVRAGRMGSGQARALRTLSDAYVVPYQNQLAAPASWFGRAAPLIVEIGFGMGQATASFAAENPSFNVLGIEVHPPGVGSLLKFVGESSLGNVRIIQHDAVEVLNAMLGPASVAGFHVFFPDPWHKKRHHKRRLIQPPLVRTLCERLRPGGYLHLATDWAPYAQQMLAVLQQEAMLVNTAAVDFVPRPDTRLMTKFERRGLALGHGVWDLVFQRVGEG